MFKKIFITLSIAAAATFAGAGSVGALPQYVGGTFKEDACKGLTQISGGNACNGDAAENKIGSLVNSIVNLLSLIVGIIAVIMIIVAGFKYVTSGGDSNNVSGAKSTLVYAIVGLIIVALAQFIVRFVMGNV